MSDSLLNKNINKQCLKFRLRSRLMLFFCLSGIVIALPGQAPISAPKVLLKQPPANQSVRQIYHLAKAITVKVLSAEALGSGILIQRQGQVYWVLTNAHVLRAGDSPYRIQTPDGRIYSAALSKNISFKGNDLGLLQFHTASSVYSVASVGTSSTLAVGDEVFAGGFPVLDRTSRASEFTFTKGQVSFVLDKALQEGYQIGYTNDIEKGMSGGPLLTRQGNVVGINGMHAYPLWDIPSLYKDGSQPCKPLQELITRYSWAIPLETLVQLARHSITLKDFRFSPSVAQVDTFRGSNAPVVDGNVSDKTLQMRSQAEAAKNCVSN